MTRNEQIASILLEAAELLKEDYQYYDCDESHYSLNEGIDSQVRLIKKIKSSADFTKDEKDEAIKWLEQNYDKLNDNVTKLIENKDRFEKINARMTVAFIVTMPTVIIPFILGIILMIVNTISGKRIFDASNSLKTIKRKLRTLNEAELDENQRKMYNRIIDKIDEFEDTYSAKVKAELQ